MIILFDELCKGFIQFAKGMTDSIELFPYDKNNTF